MTKEEIYDKYIKNTDPEWTTWELKGNFLEAMDQYAEQEAKNFADWMAENHIWWNRTYQKWTGVESYTTSELYKLFLSQKK